jgi:hypothetical protein
MDKNIHAFRTLIKYYIKEKKEKCPNLKGLIQENFKFEQGIE